MSWIDANQQVPEFYKFTGQSLPVLVIAETGDACFQQTMAVYRRGVAGGRRAFVWCVSRFDDDRQGAVITVRCWMPPPKMPRDIPGKWDQEAIAPATEIGKAKP